MPRFRNYQTNFTGGLLSEGMLGRLDLAQYENGCRQLDNWWPSVTGGMSRRPGTVYLNDLTGYSRIESFIFNENQTYIIAFGAPNKIRIWNPDTGAQIGDLTTGFSLTEEIIQEMSVTQKGDVMFLAHESWVMQKLTRVSAGFFQTFNFVFEGTPPDNDYPKKMPFIKFEGAEVTITSSGFEKGTITTLTASEAVFTSRHVGRAIRYRGKQILVTGLVGSPEPRTQVTGTILEELDRGAVLTFNTSIHEPEDFQVGEIVVGRDSGIKAEVIELSGGSISVSMIAGIWPTSATEDIEGLQSGNIAGITAVGYVNPIESADWDEEAFSDELGWPSAIEFHSQRLWLGGSSSLPAHIFGSRVAAFFNFDVGDAFAADSIQASISGNQINKINNIVSGRHLQLLTDYAEFYAPQSEDLPLVPETFDLLKQTRYGSKKNRAVVFDESTLFIQSEGSAIREFVWQASQRGYSADAVSLVVDDYIVDVQELEVLYGGYDRPEQMAFFVCGNGTIVWYHAARAEQIRTWGRWTTQGLYKSVTVLQDHLFALVERVIDGQTVQYLERFEFHATLDCQITVASPTPLGGMFNAVQHLPNTEVDIVTSVESEDTPAEGQELVADYYFGKYMSGATGGLSWSSTGYTLKNITAGLSYTQKLEIMPIEVKDQQGVSTGMPKRLVYVDLYLASTLAASMSGNKIKTFNAQDDLTEKPEPVTGVRKFYLFGYSERPTIIVENDIPVACEVLSLGAEVEY